VSEELGRLWKAASWLISEQQHLPEVTQNSKTLLHITNLQAEIQT
jgi:hypothetical protein